MIDQATGVDASDFGEMIVEEQSTFEEPITIRRFVSRPPTPGAFQTPQGPTFTDFPSTAVVVEMGAAAKILEAGVLSAGDLVLQMRDRLRESDENIGGSQLADRVVYRGTEYRMVQRPNPISMGNGLSGDVLFYVVHLRRTNSTSDTVGL